LLSLDGSDWATQNNILGLTVDRPDDDSVAPSDVIVRLFLATCVVGRLLQVRCSLASPLPVAIGSEVDFHSAAQQEVRLLRVRLCGQLDLRGKVLIDLEYVV